MKSLTFLFFCGCLSGFQRSIILEQVHKIDIRPISDSFEQAEESRRRAACKERLQAIKHHSLVAVTQLRIKSKRKKKSAIAHALGSQLVSKPACQRTPAIIVPRASAQTSSDLSLCSANLCNLQLHPRIPAHSPGLLRQQI